jgi:hypothetical protein
LGAHFVLVDFENVQPRNLGQLRSGAFKVMVFVGASQSKVSLELAQALQGFGADAGYLQIAGNGSNALDFHIAYYIGRLAAQHPGAAFTIVSRDTGFDPLIKHLATLKIACRRVKAIGDIKSGDAKPGEVKTQGLKSEAAAKPQKSAPVAVKPAPKPAAKAGVKKTAKAAAKPAPAHLQEALDRLKNMKAARPGTMKTLRSSIASWFKPAISETELDALIGHLQRGGKIEVAGNKVRYAFA